MTVYDKHGNLIPTDYTIRVDIDSKGNFTATGPPEAIRQTVAGRSGDSLDFRWDSCDHVLKFVTARRYPFKRRLTLKERLRGVAFL